MLSVDRKFYFRSFLLVAGVNLAVYFVYHLAYHIGQYWFDLVADYVMDAWDCLLPAVSALLLLTVYSLRGVRGALGYGLLLSLCRMFYSIPFYYLYFMDSVTSPDSLDSFVTSLLSSALVFVTYFLHISLLCTVGVLIYRRKSKDGSPALYDMLKEKCTFRFESGASAILFVLSLIQFVYAMRVPVIATVDYFAAYGLNIRVGEFIHMLFSYVFVLCMLAVCYVLLCKLKDKLFKVKKEAEDSE